MKLSEFKVSNYPDGHKHIVSDKDLHGDDMLEISIRSFDDLFLAAQAKAIHPELKYLHINYMLGARCDRRFSPGEAEDLRIVCDFINLMGWESVLVVKPHSYRTLELLKNAHAYDPTSKLLDRFKQDVGRETRICYVSPDQGASSWINELRVSPVIQGSKKRDPATGIVAGVSFVREAFWNEFSGKEQSKMVDSLDGREDHDFCIIDDLCDGGGTFIAIAKEIRSRYPAAKVYLIVTHAIFSKGFAPFNGWIDHIYCTNSFWDLSSRPSLTNPLVTQINL